jgi:hypothetical protein
VAGEQGKGKAYKRYNNDDVIMVEAFSLLHPPMM